MLRRPVPVALAILLLSTVASAQVTIQHGSTLSELINNLYGGNGIQLKETGHAAHVGRRGARRVGT